MTAAARRRWVRLRRYLPEAVMLAGGIAVIATAWIIGVTV